MASYEKFLPDALKMQNDTGIPAAIILGQALLESGAGLNSGLVQKANNFFGVKGEGPAGSIYMPTKENIRGQMVTVQGKFRKYNNPYESFVDHAKILQLPRYQSHLKNATTLTEWAEGIKAGGYATDANYVAKLMNVITSNGLDKISAVPVGAYTANLGNVITTDNPLTSGIKENALQLVQTVVKWVLLIVLFVLGMIFIMNAIPLEKAADSVTNAAGKVVKPIKAAKKIKKAIK